MVDTSAPRNEPDVPAGPARVDKTQYRPIRIIGLLLILQVIGLVGIGVYEFAQVDWEQDWEQVDPEAIPQEASSSGCRERRRVRGRRGRLLAAFGGGEAIDPFVGLGAGELGEGLADAAFEAGDAVLAP